MEQFWSIPRVWEGSTAFIIGGGPSLLGFDWNQIRGRNVIGCNDAYVLGKEICPVVCFGDQGWYYIHKAPTPLRPASLQDYTGTVITREKGLVGNPALKIVPSIALGWSTQQNLCAWNFNTGAYAINAAALYGARTIVLLGFDMKLHKDHGVANWHRNWKDRPNAKVYPMFMKHFPRVKKGADAQGIRIVNANPDSCLDIFPKMTIEEALKL